MVSAAPQPKVRPLPPGIPRPAMEQPQASPEGNLARGICTRGDDANARKNYVQHLDDKNICCLSDKKKAGEKKKKEEERKKRKTKECPACLFPQ